LDNSGNPHLIWFSTEVVDTNGVTRSENILVESQRTTEGWSTPVIVTQTAGPSIPLLSLDIKGNLLLVWQEQGGSVFSAVQEAYNCDEMLLPTIEKAGLEGISGGEFRPTGTQIPYCNNQYLSIYYTPNPQPEYSSLPVTPNGGFDQVSNISDTAKYEVLFTTMQWEPNTDPPNPGSVLAQEVASLYQAVKNNPEHYPRGMTVRILLGNYPEMSELQYGDQIWDAINVLRDAGVDKMVDPAIGCRLEIANYAGTYPHAHTKFVVADGKRVGAMGFNYGYLHFPIDHPSGRGYDMFDLGLLVSGPVAQDAISAYDDMWNGANQVHCEDLSLENENWQSTCTELKATVDHVPEVLRTYLPPDGHSNAFSLYRTNVYPEADRFLYASIAAAQETMDVIEVNFSLEMVCMLSLILPDFCTFEDALPWMNAMMEAIETNGVKVRVIMENTNSNGLENRVAGKVLMDEVTRRGLQDFVELRFYNGKLHAKSMLIDEVLVVIGSQNLHYSSWGDGAGLAEYNITNDDPQAVQEYKAMFETKWVEAIPFEDAEYGTSP
jgi:phosphatidylserine/phosphatidylglycerophosphate/cardiolipin synthase-like enzyme